MRTDTPQISVLSLCTERESRAFCAYVVVFQTLVLEPLGFRNLDTGTQSNLETA